MNEIRIPKVCASSRRIRLSLPRLVYATGESPLLDGRLRPVPRLPKMAPEVEPEILPDTPPPENLK
jgi:hypothetical protein